MKTGNKIKKYLGALVFCNLYRFMRVVPNNDPIMAFALPFAKNDKWWQAALFPLLAMISFDLITLRFGVWTLVTATVYSLIGLAFHQYSKQKTRIGLDGYATAAIVGILAFDGITGPIMSSLLFPIPFEAALIGQIPFTISHLISGVFLTLLISPAIDPALRHQSLLHYVGRKLKVFSLRVGKNAQ